jgi:hypothetical protein
MALDEVSIGTGAKDLQAHLSHEQAFSYHKDQSGIQIRPIIELNCILLDASRISPVL